MDIKALYDSVYALVPEHLRVDSVLSQVSALVVACNHAHKAWEASQPKPEPEPVVEPTPEPEVVTAPAEPTLEPVAPQPSTILVPTDIPGIGVRIDTYPAEAEPVAADETVTTPDQQRDAEMRAQSTMLNHLLESQQRMLTQVGDMISKFEDLRNRVTLMEYRYKTRQDAEPKASPAPKADTTKSSQPEPKQPEIFKL